MHSYSRTFPRAALPHCAAGGWGNVDDSSHFSERRALIPLATRTSSAAIFFSSLPLPPLPPIPPSPS